MGNRARWIAGILSIVPLALVGCGDDTSSETTGASVAVTLQEWSVLADPNSAAAGKVTFNVTNKGKAHEHEFVVIKTDLDPSALPVGADGSVNEDGGGFTAVGEIEDIALGANPSTSFTLTAGKYVMFCNVVEDTAAADMGGITSHYKLGMRTGFTVT